MTQFSDRTFGKLIIAKKDTLMWLFLVMLTLPHMNPAYLNEFPMWDTFLNCWRLLSFIVVVFWVFFIRKRFSVIVIFIIVREIFLLATTFWNHGEIYESVSVSFSVLSIVILYDVAYDEKEMFLSAQLFCFEVVTYINLYTIFAVPGGLYTHPPEYHQKYWFLGLYNTYTRYFIPALMFAWLYKMQTGKKTRTYFLTAAVLITIFKVWSGGEITLIIVMFLVFVFLKNKTRYFNYYTYWSLHIVFFISIFVFRLQYLLRWFIDDFLGKWGSLTGRMRVWDRTFELFCNHPLIGHGVQNAYTVRRVEYGSVWGAHAHNLIWELLYQGGAVGILLWCIIVVSAGMRLYKYRYTEESKIIATAFLGWCIATLVEPFATCFLMGMFVIAYHSNSALPDEEIVTERRSLKRLRFAHRGL